MNQPTENHAAALGTLYLVATPIGNLEDITHRALRVLQEADAVYCEDTRRTMVLFAHFSIRSKTPLKSFHDHSHFAVVQDIKRLLEAGKNVAYVTDGGMPVVSDPGFVLVRAAREAGAPVTVVPGPSAAVMLFAASGLPSPKFLFHGFFPRTRGEVERTLEIVRQLPVVHIFYEAPGRIVGAFEILNRHIPEAQGAVGRELTKLHEELLQGTIAKIYSELASREKVRGECVLAVMGGAQRPEAFRGTAAGSVENERSSADLQPESGSESISLDAGEDENAGRPVRAARMELSREQQLEILSLIKAGTSSKDAAKLLSKKFGVSRKIIYEFIIRHLT